MLSVHNCKLLCAGQLWINANTHSAATSSFCVEGARPADIHVYGDDSLQPTAVFDWSKRFKEGRSRMEDLAPPGHTPDNTDPDTCARVVQMVTCDHDVTLRHISEHLGISLGLVHHMSCKF